MLLSLTNGTKVSNYARSSIVTRFDKDQHIASQFDTIRQSATQLNSTQLSTKCHAVQQIVTRFDKDKHMARFDRNSTQFSKLRPNPTRLETFQQCASESLDAFEL